MSTTFQPLLPIQVTEKNKRCSGGVLREGEIKVNRNFQISILSVAQLNQAKVKDGFVELNFDRISAKTKQKL